MIRFKRGVDKYGHVCQTWNLSEFTYLSNMSYFTNMKDKYVISHT